MSHAILFDTLAYANRLKDAGVPIKQAEAQSEALAEILDNQVVAKKELSEIETRLEAKTNTEFETALYKTEERVNIKFAKIDEKFAKIDEKFAKVDEKFAKVDEKFAKVDEKFAELRCEIKDIKIDVIKWMASFMLPLYLLVITILLKMLH